MPHTDKLRGMAAVNVSRPHNGYASGEGKAYRTYMYLMPYYSNTVFVLIVTVKCKWPIANILQALVLHIYSAKFAFHLEVRYAHLVIPCLEQHSVT